MPLMCLFYWLLQLKSALWEFAILSRIVSGAYKMSFSKGRGDMVFEGCVSLLYYHHYFYHHRHLWVIFMIIIGLIIKKSLTINLAWERSNASLSRRKWLIMRSTWFVIDCPQHERLPLKINILLTYKLILLQS